MENKKYNWTLARTVLEGRNWAACKIKEAQEAECTTSDAKIIRACMCKSYRTIERNLREAYHAMTPEQENTIIYANYYMSELEYFRHASAVEACSAISHAFCFVPYRGSDLYDALDTAVHELLFLAECEKLKK